MPHYRAIQAWQVHYTDPIRGAAGDRLTLGRRDDEFPGWIWAEAGGRAGWVPESWLRVEENSGYLICDYTAAELPLEPGDEVSGELVESGWLWATTAAGRIGWAPLTHLEIMP